MYMCEREGKALQHYDVILFDVDGTLIDSAPGILNTLDDIHSVRVQNMAFDNFLYAGYEAYAAMTINRDPMLQEHLRKVAEEDFAFATEKFEREGFDLFKQMYEHSYNTSESQYMATISWSASMLYKLTGKANN